MPSPVMAVHWAPAIPMDALSRMASAIAHSTDVPSKAPVRVARMTSPEPMYSAHQTKDGPTTARMARPRGAMRMRFSIGNVGRIVREAGDWAKGAASCGL